jgi:hypothetical protein
VTSKPAAGRGLGRRFVGWIAEDLRVETGSARGFSRRNLFYMRRFAAVWPEAEKVQTLSAQIGWSHHQVLLDAWADQPELHLWYAAKAAENRWSVRRLQGQIALGLHERQGAAVTNFAAVRKAATPTKLYTRRRIRTSSTSSSSAKTRRSETSSRR